MDNVSVAFFATKNKLVSTPRVPESDIAKCNKMNWSVAICEDSRRRTVFLQISVSSCSISSLEPVPEASFTMADFPLLKPEVLNAICKLSGMVSFEKEVYQVG